MKNGAILAVVLEDHENDRNRLISFIARYAQEHSVKIETVSFGNGLELIRNYSADFDLLFVDIELPGLDGMKVSEKNTGYGSLDSDHYYYEYGTICDQGLRSGCARLYCETAAIYHVFLLFYKGTDKVRAKREREEK